MANSSVRGYQRQNYSRRRTEGLLATETAIAVRAAYSSKELRRLANEQARRLRTTATMLDGVSHQEAAIVRRCGTDSSEHGALPKRELTKDL
jgi:hypothetical protein